MIIPYLPQVLDFEELLKRVLDQVFPVYFYFIETGGKVVSVMIDLVVEPDQFVPSAPRLNLCLAHQMDSLHFI